MLNELLADSGLRCVFCGHDKNTVLFTATQELASSLADSYSITDNSQGMHSDIFSCLKCGGAFTKRIDQDDQLVNYYRDQPLDLVYLSEERGRRRAFGRIIERIKSFFTGKKQGKILDIGCGPGIFLSEADRRGFDAWGVDLSTNSIEFARRKFGLKNVFQMRVEEITNSFPENSFDVITMFDVLEHVADPSKAIGIVDGKLKRGGYLVLTLPIIDFPGAKIMNKRWHALIPSHLNYFSKNALKLFFEPRGFEIVKINYYGHYFSPLYLFRKLFKNSTLNIPFVSGYEVPVNLFDEGEIYLKKVR